MAQCAMQGSQQNRIIIYGSHVSMCFISSCTAHEKVEPSCTQSKPAKLSLLTDLQIMARLYDLDGHIIHSNNVCLDIIQLWEIYAQIIDIHRTTHSVLEMKLIV